VRNPRIGLFFVACLAAAAANAAAQDQAPGPAGSPPRGFSSQMLITQLSLYLPEEATRGMNRGFAGRPGGPSAQEGQPGQTGQGAGARPPFPQIPRDPKLFLTREQITRLLPILTALRESPLPTPAKAKQVRADVDAVLTADQKGEWTSFQKKLQDFMQQFRQGTGANGPPGQGATGGAGSAGGAGTAGGAGAPGGAPQATLLQRRQRQLDAFIKVLQDRLNVAGA
jgi:hypothetical protein